MDKKLLFVDLDGTLLSSDKSISDGNLKAISKLIEEGHGFIICTGRPLYSAMLIADRYGFNKEGFFVASYNGGQIYDCSRKEIIYSAGLGREHVRFLLDKANSMGIHAHTYSSTHVLAEHETEMLEFYSGRIKMPYKIVDDVLEHIGEEAPKVIIADLYDRSKLVSFEESVRDIMDPVANSVFSDKRLLEYGSLNASKGIAIERLCSIMGVDISNSIAAGDEENDISMLKAAGLGVAMANAVPSVKAVADAVTDNDNDNDGIAELIYRYILGEYGI